MPRASFECSGCGKQQSFEDRGVRTLRPCSNCQDTMDWERTEVLV